MEKEKLSIRALIVSLVMLLLSPFATGAQALYGDVNSDGEVSVFDVIKLIDFLLEGGSSEGHTGLNRGVISVKDYGAVGDGVTDDTEAMERAFAYAGQNKLALYVPRGTYMIRRPLTLMSGMEIYGDGSSKSIIKKFPAAWHKLTEAIATGVYNEDEYNSITIRVDGVSGYHVGDHCFISYSNNPFQPGNTKARYCTYGEIVEINETPIIVNEVEQYEVKIKSAHDSEKHGVVYTHPVGAVLSTSFPILRSWAFKDECINVYIHDICLDGNRQTEGPLYNGVTYEPMEWANACIHFDAYGTTKVCGISYNNHSYNHAVVRCKLINASYDGLSDQGEGGLYVKDCTIQNNAMSGVHLGTVFENAVIADNKMTGVVDRGAGVFFCQDVTNVIIEGNTFNSFHHGCSDEEYATEGKYNIIRNNTFNNTDNYVFDFLKATSSRHGGGLLITGNTISGLNAPMFCGKYLEDVIISKNKITSLSPNPPSSLIITNNTNGLIIVGNTLPTEATISTPVTLNNTTNVVQAANSWD